jgi:hypothetical protein
MGIYDLIILDHKNWFSDSFELMQV